MKDLRHEQLKNDVKMPSTTAYYVKKFTWSKTLKIVKYFLIISIITFIIVKPEFTGSIIGTWIHDFFGNIFKESKF